MLTTASDAFPEDVAALAPRFSTALLRHLRQLAPRIEAPSFVTSQVDKLLSRTPDSKAGQRRPGKRDNPMSVPENKSYFPAAMNAFSPWGTRSTTPKPGQERDEQEQAPEPQRGRDHFVGQKHRLSLKNYPRDCPPLKVQWYFAVDVPKRKPNLNGLPIETPEKHPLPKKWDLFSESDSKSIEAAFQKLSEESEASDRQKLAGLNSPADTHFGSHESGDVGDIPELKTVKVPVNEDYLFDVDVQNREFGPAYWLGPVYEIRRGTWFYSDGVRLKPCEENLAYQLEEGYLKIKPWRFAPEQPRPGSQTRSRPTSLRAGAGEELAKALRESKSASVTPKSSNENLKSQFTPNSAERAGRSQDTSLSSPMKAHRLFGSYMNSVVTYQDSRTAWLLTDDFMSRMSSTVYQRFAGGAHFAGTKLIRGYEDKSTGPIKDGKLTDGPGSASEVEDSDGHSEEGDESVDGLSKSPSSPSEVRRKTLERQMSSLVASAEPEDLAKQEEEVRKRAEKEIRNDYKEREGDEQDREIEHLLLVTHGIGQRLGIRMESVNFVHDVNTMRKTLKSVYSNSPDLQALNGEVEKLPKNCRVQVLPICWRHLLDFPKQSLRHNRQEHDLGDTDFDDDEYPTLEEITVDGVPAVRNLITDLALDILLYQSPAYKSHISRIVLQECNRIYALFKERNPNFKGKVSLVGHSLGSAIMFDLLCRQPQHKSKWARQQPKQQQKGKRNGDEVVEFDFEVEDFYALGSPIGLFQMLKGRTLAARQAMNFVPPETPGDLTDDPFLGPPLSKSAKTFDITTSAPKCQQVFNIFHPTDPISYRLEPLISPAMASLKPQPLPYTKRGIFGAPVGQGLNGISARVGQSVSGFWSGFTSGIASSLLNRSLGLSAEDQSKLGNATSGPQSRAPLSMGNNPLNPSGAPLQHTGSDLSQYSNDEKKRRLTGLTTETIATGDDGEHPLTLIDSEIETLYSGFQKGRKTAIEDDKAQTAERASDEDTKEADLAAEEWADLEEKSRKLKREEAKVRALNANGRVDYSIQE